MGSREGFARRQEALEALEKSTTMLEVALELTRQGNHEEATRLRGEAQTQRTISTLLMSEADNLEGDRKAIRAQLAEIAQREHFNRTSHRSLPRLPPTR